MFKAAIVPRLLLATPLLALSVLARPSLTIASVVQPPSSSQLSPQLNPKPVQPLDVMARAATEPIKPATSLSVAQTDRLYAQLTPATPTLEPTSPTALTLEQASVLPQAPQVTSVSQLGDIKPTDWAFQALQSLVERYGCIVGYPDKTYRGNRALTRYEFAAGLNACMDRINELIAAGTADRVKKEDLVALQKL